MRRLLARLSTMCCYDGCRLQELPPTVGALSGLRSLLIGRNQLQQLPGSISLLQQLHTLHAGADRGLEILRAPSRRRCTNYDMSAACTT